MWLPRLTLLTCFALVAGAGTSTLADEAPLLRNELARRVLAAAVSEAQKQGAGGACHPGTVWPWLLGPLVETWVRSRGGGVAVMAEARRCPFQAWSASELLRLELAIVRSHGAASISPAGAEGWS